MRRLPMAAGGATSGFSLKLLERRMLFAGVTLITHGFELQGSSTEDVAWGDAMAQAIAAQAGSGTPILDLVVDGAGNTTLQQVSGQPVDASPNGEVVIFLNWSALSDNLIYANTNTAYIASVVAPVFTETFPSLGIDQPLGELPIHLIGHSRGGSLVSALAEDLGTEGIWVDQLTTLDPHPVQSSLLINVPDPDASVYSNVLFADNYFETDQIYPQGTAIAGAHNTDLTPASIGHSGTHSYYYGTIDTSASDDGDSSGPVAIDPTWYDYSGTGPRDSTGFYYSLIDGGARPADGIGSAFGGSAARVAVPSVSGAWANIDDLQLIDSGSTFQIGQMLHAQYLFQDDSRAPTVTLYLDSDKNPFDASPDYQVGAQTFALGTGVLHPTSAAPLNTSSVPPGQYYLMAKITDGQTTRYAYDTTPIALTQFSPTSVSISGIAYQDITGNGFSSDDTPLAGMTINAYESDGTTPAGSTTTAADGSYSFGGLTAGSYVVREDVPNGWTVTAGAGGYAVTLTSGQSAIQKNFDDFKAPTTYLPDLSGSIVYAPPTLPPGGKRNPLVLTLKNLGNLRFTGTVPINLYASQSTGYDGSALLIATVSAQLNLSAGGAKVVTLRFDSPANVPDGDYHLLAFLNQADVLRESDYDNNVFAASTSTAIAQPFVDPAGSLQATPSVLYRGTHAFAFVTVANSGNVPASGLFAVQLLLSPDNVGGAGAIPLGQLSKKMTLKPGRSARVKISFIVPTSGDGTYLEGIVSFSGALPDTNISNNTFFSSAPVILGQKTNTRQAARHVLERGPARKLLSPFTA